MNAAFNSRQSWVRWTSSIRPAAASLLALTLAAGGCAQAPNYTPRAQSPAPGSGSAPVAAASAGSDGTDAPEASPPDSPSASQPASAPAATTTSGTGRLPDAPPAPTTSGFDRTDNYREFIDAYRRGGRPRLVVYTDIVGRDGSTSKTLNDLGTLARFGPRLESYFRGPEITLVNAEAMGLATRQQVSALARNDEYAAARMLGESLKADVVLMVRMLEQPRRNDGADYATSYVLADLRRGTTLGTWSFDMTRDPDDREFTSRRMSEYARAIAGRSMSEFIEMFPGGGELAGGRPFTIRVVGDYEDDDLSAFRDVLRTMQGVRPDTVSLRAEDKSRAQAMSTFELFFAGDLLDLRRAARRAAVDQMAMEAQIIDSREGVIDLRLAPLALTERERMFTGGPETPRNGAARRELRDGYTRAGAPSIAVVINRAAVEKDEPLATDAPLTSPAMTVGGTAVIVADRVNIGSGFGDSGFGERLIDRELRDRREERREDAVIDTRAFEDSILQRLVQLGLSPKDVSGAQAALLADASFNRAAQDDRSLAFALGQKAGADIVISGVGRLVRSRADNRPVRVIFTMRAFKVGDGAVLGAATVQRDVTGEESINQVVTELSAEATGKMVATMADVWARTR